MKYPHWIMQRSFGGTSVADTPGVSSENNWPNGRSAPASRECCNLLIDACNSNDSSKHSVLVFLVGGAGNGKSYLAKDVTNRIKGKKTTRKAKFASRLYDYKLDNGKLLRVVNDATIPPKEENGNSDYLVQDIKHAVEENGNLLVCVNRGVLVSEVTAIDKDSQECDYQVSAMIVKWLLDGKVPVINGGCDGWKVTLSDELQGNSYYTFCSIESPSGRTISVHVAFMDHVSLLEPFPITHVSTADLPFTQPLKVTSVKLLPVGYETRRNNETTLHEVLGKFFDDVKEEIGSNKKNDTCPVSANIATLVNGEILDGFCSILRSSEIISGNRITYRDAWGIATLSITGVVPTKNIEELGDWVKTKISIAKNGDILARLRSLVELSLHRVHMSLFSGTGPSFLIDSKEQPSYPVVQAIESLRKADPLVGLSDKVKEKVHASLVLIEEEVGPGDALAKNDKVFARVWTSLDAQLESSILDWLYKDEEGPKFTERNEMLAWYGQYLSRLCALAYGKSSNYLLVKRWQKYWTIASARRRDIPSDLDKGLKSLIFMPYENGEAKSFLPIFSPRVVPITKGSDAKKIVMNIHSGEYKWELACNGDVIIVRLKKYGFEEGSQAEFILDFPMLREVSAQFSGGGFTDASIDVEPRVERVRAEILSMETRSAYKKKELPAISFIDGETILP